jgi:hypothetical protein
MVIAGIFAFAGSLILDRAWKRSQDMARAILLYDKQSFMLLRDEKIPNILVIAPAFGLPDARRRLGSTRIPTPISSHRSRQQIPPPRGARVGPWAPRAAMPASRWRLYAL